MRLLVLGGTRFVGRHLVEAALQRGHSVTVFNRRRSHPGLWRDVEELRGDRDGPLEALQDHSWDAVVDTSGYVPRIVRLSAEALADATGRYLFVSSVSVYRPGLPPGVDEGAPVAELDDASTEEVTDETYGGLKALCERVVEEIYGERSLVVRPGLVVGPHDETDRFTYWVRRVARGGRVLAPGRPERSVQLIDGRDLGSWMVTLVEGGFHGVFNATGPADRLTMGELLERCRGVIGSDASFAWVPEAALLEAGVQPWTELPLWIPESDPESSLDSVDSARARTVGLTLRPLGNTVLDTLAWDEGRGPDMAAGLTARREKELLESFGC
jgi:2'-hydroxyisoflavone reductase